MLRVRAALIDFLQLLGEAADPFPPLHIRDPLLLRRSGQRKPQ